MGEEEAVKIDVDFQGQAALEEGGGQEIQIGQEEFPFIARLGGLDVPPNFFRDASG
jgi:hypothetical protein